VKGDREEVQSWSMGAAVRWRRDLRDNQRREAETFSSAYDMWLWIDGFCRKGMRTVAMAHNLGYDVRIAQVLDILPKLGWVLEWCNLDRNVSAMTWRSDHGTLVLADLYTWLPMPLQKVGELLDLPKLQMPHPNASKDRWERYCLRDAEIVAAAMGELVDFIDTEQLGNWQPTGAGMSYATWRHKFMTHKVLVHDHEDVIAAERAAMHTGRAEAWRHGNLSGEVWTEADMRTAYTHIAAESELPTKYKFTTGAITTRQYEELSSRYRVLCLCDVSTDLPVVPYHNGERTLWPVGRFTTWLWDVEVNELLGEGQGVRILRSHVYTKAPILGDWAHWVLGIVNAERDSVSPVVRAYAKHCGRALIGRLALRAPRWEVYGGNPGGEVGISHDVDYASGQVRRMMHVGDRTLVETERVEGRDSLPQVTGWIMAECRVRLHWAMRAAGYENLAHVDTDSVLVNKQGLINLRGAYGAAWGPMWQVKGSWSGLTVFGPRNLRAGRERKVAGVPRSAREVAPNVFVGEQWRGLAADVESGRHGAVTVSEATWTVKRSDPRRADAPGVTGRTVAVRVNAA